MKGKKLLLLALAVLTMLGTLSGCAKSADEVLGMVGETPIYRWAYEKHLGEQLVLYEKYYGIDLTDKAYQSKYKEYKQARLNDLVGDAALKEEARVRGLYELTDAQELEIDQQYQQYYESKISTLLQEYGSNEEGRRQAEKAYTTMLEESWLTPERVRSLLKDEYVLNLLIAQLGKTLEITQEEIQQEYDRLLEDQKTNCEKDANWFGKNAPLVPVYIPEGYVKVMRIRKTYDQEQLVKLQSAYSQVEEAGQAYAKEVLSSGENSLTASIKKDAMERCIANYESIQEQVMVVLRAQMAQVRQQISCEEDFHALVSSENQDKNIVDYYVCATSEHVEETFRDAALALQEVGDVSDVVDLSDGVCIILLEEKLEPGVRPLEDVQDQIRRSLGNTKAISLDYELSSEYQQKAEEAGIITLYPEKL